MPKNLPDHWVVYDQENLDPLEHSITGTWAPSFHASPEPGASLGKTIILPCNPLGPRDVNGN